MDEVKSNVHFGKLGAKFGKLGGRPTCKGKPFGLNALEYEDIKSFLTSPKTAPVYPIRMRGASSHDKDVSKKRRYSRNKDRQKQFRPKAPRNK